MNVVSIHNIFFIYMPLQNNLNLYTQNLNDSQHFNSDENKFPQIFGFEIKNTTSIYTLCVIIQQLFNINICISLHFQSTKVKFYCIMVLEHFHFCKFRRI